MSRTKGKIAISQVQSVVKGFYTWPKACFSPYGHYTRPKGEVKMQNMFYISEGQETVGPLTIPEISDRLITNISTEHDFVYLESKQDWIRLLDFMPVMKRIEILVKSNEVAL
jgi:hypothetical protein